MNKRKTILRWMALLCLAPQSAVQAQEIQENEAVHRVERFDSHAWSDMKLRHEQQGEYAYSSLHATEGNQALQVMAPLKPLSNTHYLDNNSVSFGLATPLLQTEDWSKYRFVTIDIYMGENPTGLSEARLYLTNSAGKTEYTSLILGWQLFQWENRQMTFPLRPNAYLYGQFSAEVLRDVKDVRLSLCRYSDQTFDTARPLSSIEFHVDNMKLDGHRLWDAFEAPAAWSCNTALSLAHPSQAPDSMGGVLMVSARPGIDFLSIRSRNVFSNRPTPAGWAPDRMSVWFWSRNTMKPVRAKVGGVMVGFGKRMESRGQWTRFEWKVGGVFSTPIPPSELEFLVNSPVDENFLLLEDILLICKLPAARPVKPAHFARRRSSLVLDISRNNGAILSIKDRESDRLLFSGNESEELWKLYFNHDDALPMLSAGMFAPGKEGARFILHEPQQRLQYIWERDTQYLEINFQFRLKPGDLLDIVPEIINKTPYTIRKLILPRRLCFPLDDLKEVLYPVQDGIVLLPEFFREKRSSFLGRPPLFADVIGIRTANGGYGVYLIQDSRYHMELIPRHNHKLPVTQPMNIGVGANEREGWLEFEYVTSIGINRQWIGPTLRIRNHCNFMELAEAYRMENGFNDTNRYPTLAQKLGSTAAMESLGQQMVQSVEMYKMVEWNKAPEGKAWTTIRDDWMARLPRPGILHLTHWQKGRDGDPNPLENNKLEDNHPEALPIWWGRYGPEQDLQSMMRHGRELGFQFMPFTNWTVWNTLDPQTGQLPVFAETPAAVRKARGPAYPYMEYKGYMIKPWHKDVRLRNDRMFNYYTYEVPQELMFVDMTGERSWRYMLGGNDTTVSVAAYTQAVINENYRLSKKKPLFTEGVYDRIANSVTGYCQTHKQKFWNGILYHLGDEFTHWAAYPFAAAVLHDLTAFYPHDLNSEVWPSESRALLSYYCGAGYNFMVDLTKHMGEEENSVRMLGSFQQSVNGRSFGRKMLSHRWLTEDYSAAQTVWDHPEGNWRVTTLFRTPEHAEPVRTEQGFGIAPDGFFARFDDLHAVSGIFTGLCFDAPLAPGDHYLRFESGQASAELYYLRGPGTILEWPLASALLNQGELYVEFLDGTAVRIRQPERTARGFRLLVGETWLGMPVKRWMVRMSGSRDIPGELILQRELARWNLSRATYENLLFQAEDNQVVLQHPAAHEGAGKYMTEPITAHFDQGVKFRMKVDGVSPGTKFAIQFQEEGGGWQAINVFQGEADTEIEVDAGKLTQWAGPRRVRLVVWVEGANATLKLSNARLDAVF